MSATETETSAPWQSTACILCACNCGIEVQVEGRDIVRVRGDRRHPGSKGYACEKAQRLQHYQGAERLTRPQRRRTDGTYETVEWDEAIAEVAERLAAVAAEHGGTSILYYGGGGQGNHLGGAYARATRAALGSRFASNALAQEKTGEFWVDAQLFGAVRHTAPDFEHAEVAVFVGKNPWQAHGFPRARVVLKEIAADPERSLIVIDPRRTETAAMADIHLQVRPGGDAFLLAALLAVLVEDDLVDDAFLEEHTTGADDVLAALRTVDVAAFAARAGVEEVLVRAAARRIGTAASVSILEDLGIQQAPNSTLSSYLEKLIWALTGQFAREGTTNLHSFFAPGTLIGQTAVSRRTTPVTGERIIGGMIPAAAIPDAVLTDSPDRFRAAIVESSNPVHSLPDSPRMREVFEALDFSVVIDVAMTETARCADYVLPAASQYEKWECTFFNLEFPENVFQLRAPVVEPPPGVLTEPEIHTRLVRALGALSDADLAGLREAAEQGLEPFAAAFGARMGERPHLLPLAPVVLRETLGPTLPDGAASAAVLWGLAQIGAAMQADSVRRAGFAGDGPALGNALFEAILRERSGVAFTVDPYEETWARVEHPGGRLALAIPELLDALGALPAEDDGVDPDYPFVLAAGERRTSTANTIIRDPAWRRRDASGALRMSVEDAESLGVASGVTVRVSTRRGSATVPVEVTDTLRAGHITLPNGFGLTPDRGEQPAGVAPNELTSGARRDPVAGTPWHKHVPARVEVVA